MIAKRKSFSSRAIARIRQTKAGGKFVPGGNGKAKINPEKKMRRQKNVRPKKCCIKYSPRG